jgi:quercetin dioxygenase-like cupin family protein
VRASKIEKIMRKKPSWAADDGETKFWTGDEFNKGGTWIGQFKGQSPWEYHPNGDEIIYVIKGKVEITVLTKKRRKRSIVTTGSYFVIPKGHWHRQRAIGKVTEFGATSGNTRYSDKDDPR